MVQRIVRLAGDVDDVVEEAFWEAWGQAERDDAWRGSVQTWLLTIARRRALERVRTVRRQREEPLEGDAENDVLQLASDSDPAVDAEAAERRRVVLAALATLPPEQRQALDLGDYAGLSQAEIPERTAQPPGTVKTRMRLGMQNLRDHLQSIREDA